MADNDTNGQDLERLVDLLVMLAEEAADYYENSNKQEYAEKVRLAAAELNNAVSALDRIFAAYNALKNSCPPDPSPATGDPPPSIEPTLKNTEAMNKGLNEQQGTTSYTPNGRDLLFSVIEAAGIIGALDRKSILKHSIRKTLAEPANAETRKRSLKTTTTLEEKLEKTLALNPELQGKSADTIAQYIFADLDKKLPSEIPDVLKSARRQNKGLLLKANSIAKRIRPLLHQNRSSQN